MFIRRHQETASPMLGKTEADPPSSKHPSRVWTKGVVICSWVIGGVLALNIILTIIAAGLSYSKNSAQRFSFASLYSGKCSVAKNWTTGVHLLINILSTAMLGASNYCMQCLASPSRAQVDEAHRRKTWVGIGVPNIISLLRHQRGRRRFLGCLLLITSLPIHLIYNSAIFFSLGPAEYAVVSAQDSALRGNLSTDFEKCFATNVGIDLPSFNAAMANGEFRTLSKQQCVDTFAQDYVSGQRTLVLVTNASVPENEPVAWIGKGNYKGFNSKTGSSFTWLCDGDHDCTKSVAEQTIGNWSVQGRRWSTPILHLSVPIPGGVHLAKGSLNIGYYGIPYTEDYRHLRDLLSKRPFEAELQAELDDSSTWANSSFPGNVTILGHEPNCVYPTYDPPRLPESYPVDRCMAFPAEETCQLFFSPPICLIVICCNIIKLICTLFTARDNKEEIFLTVGDAIASFLTDPDPTTEGACLLSQSLVEKNTQGWRKSRAKSHGKDSEYSDQLRNQELPLRLPPKQRWFQAASKSRWVLTITLFACMLIPAGYLLRLGIIDFNNAYGTKSIWEYNLGEVSTATVLTGLDLHATTNGIFSMVFMANVPQLLISVAYFMYNGLLTCMLSAVEYDNYAMERKPLRVSWPRGAQRSTYYLSLPYRYSIPLLIVSAVLHWLVSQSLFFVEIVPFDLHGVAQDGEEVVTCGYSPVAIIFAIIVGASLLVVAMLLGMRRFRSHMPLAGQCSAAISAACHPMTAGGNHALKPVQWGEVGRVSVHRWFSNQIPGYSELPGVRFGSGGDAQWQISIASHDMDSSEAVESGLYHCSFGSGDVSGPVSSRLYI